MPQEPPARILIVDDETAQMKALCDTLREQGFETTGFSSARDALRSVKPLAFDLLLADLMMPEMDGIALLGAALKVDPALVGMIMTGEGTITTAVEAMKTGALDYILKPFKLSAILPAISRGLALRRLRLENEALQKCVRDRTAALELANRELDSFASSIAHDLHAPARQMAGYAEIVLHKYSGGLDSEAQRFLRNIAECSQRMGNLIADLLRFCRQTQTEMQWRPVQLNTLVFEARAELEKEAPDRKIVWTVAELPVVNGDEAMLRQVFINLLSNAVKYTRQKNPAEIGIGYACDEGGAFRFRVSDNGVGFDMRHAENLFGVFQRLHPADQFEGTGIGLANVRRIVSRHGGRTWAEAEPGKGATFYFTLPASPP